MVKKRRTASSSAPSTPALASPSKEDEGTPAPYSHLADYSASATPAPAHEERNVMKQPTLVPGSGDGPGYGDECFLWTDLPMNKNGYRYYPCTLSPNVSPSPVHPFYRTIPGPLGCPVVHLSWVDRSGFLRMSADAMTVSTDKGFRSVRGNVAVRTGTYYYEAIVERGDGAGGAGRGTSGGEVGNAHVRVGWARREAALDAPVGSDAYSYGVRDVGGEKVHIARPRPYGKEFRTGDVVGCLIHLPPRPETEVRRWRVPLRYKGQSYFEMDEYPVAKEMEALVNREGRVEVAELEVEKKKGGKKMGGGGGTVERRQKARELPLLEGSYVSFYLNGEPMAEDVAFEGLYDFLPLPPVEGERTHHRSRLPASLERERESYQYHDDGIIGYFPMVSCFGRGKVRVNFGPEWEKAPRLPEGVQVKPLCDRWDEFRAEELIWDEKDEAATAERLRKEMEAAALEPEVVSVKQISKKRKKATPGPGETAPPTAEGTPASTPAPEGTPLPSSILSPEVHDMEMRASPVIKIEPEVRFADVMVEPEVKPGVEPEIQEEAKDDTTPTKMEIDEKAIANGSNTHEEIQSVDPVEPAEATGAVVNDVSSQ